MSLILFRNGCIKETRFLDREGISHYNTWKEGVRMSPWKRQEFKSQREIKKGMNTLLSSTKADVIMDWHRPSIISHIQGMIYWI